MPNTTVTAADGDTLCTLAIAAGFLNCDPVRALAENASLLNRPLKAGDLVTIPPLRVIDLVKAAEALHSFVRKSVPTPSIRFTHGSPNLPYKDDPTLSALAVSNCVTNKAGNNTSAFPATFGFNQNGHSDEDTFKIEVVEPDGGADLMIELEALRPIYKPDGTILRHEPFADAGAALRKLKVQCQKVKTKTTFKGYRSRYMRLVTDEVDLKALSGNPPRADGSAQALLVTDLADGAGGADDRVEILDQVVRATYKLQTCKAPDAQRCRVEAMLPIGGVHGRAAIAVHILKDASGTAVATQQLTRQRVLNYVRQLYAQADLGVKFVQAIRDVPLPANMFAVANADGKPAVGAKTIRVRVRIDPAVDQTVTVTTTVGARPIATADAIADALRLVLPAGTRVDTSENPPLVGQAIGSADVLVGEPLTQTIRLNVLQSDDTAHPVVVGRLTTTTVAEFGGADAHVGTIEERVLVKNYDTGADRIDLFVVQALGSGSLGEAFTPNFGSAAARQPIALMSNSALVFAATINTAEHFYTTIPHEMGHVLMDKGHADPARELMGQGSPVGANERVVNGPKRINEVELVKFDDGSRVRPVTALRTANAALIHAW